MTMNDSVYPGILYSHLQGVKLNAGLPSSSIIYNRTQGVHLPYQTVNFITCLQVVYDVDGFCERNRDVLFTDLVLLMQSSSK